MEQRKVTLQQSDSGAFKGERGWNAKRVIGKGKTIKWGRPKKNTRPDTVAGGE